MIASIKENLIQPIKHRYEQWRTSRENRYAELSELDRLHAQCLRVITMYGTQSEVDGMFHYQFVLPDQGLNITVTAMDTEAIIDYEHLNPALQFQHLRIEQGVTDSNGDYVNTASLVDPYNECIHSYHQASAQGEYNFNAGGPDFSKSHLDEAIHLYHSFLAESILPALGAYEAQIAAIAYTVSPYQ